MEILIRNAIIEKSNDLLKKAEKQKYFARKYNKRLSSRLGASVVSGNTYSDPVLWSLSKHFNPKYCRKHARFLAKVIWKKIQSGRYEPAPAAAFTIKKADGSDRKIRAYSIPDIVVAKIVFDKIRKKNERLFSQFSYAYQKDRGIFDAIIKLHSYINNNKQLYVLEIDFQQYFDSIEHRYIDYLLENAGVKYTMAELYTVKSFLKHRISNAKNYSLQSEERNARGVPQGNPVSHFLANLAAHELDQRLESINGQFVRFADDVIVITKTHKDAVKAAKAFDENTKFTGISINHEKSKGISMLSSKSKIHMRSFFVDDDAGGKLAKANYVEYLGHQLDRNSILFSENRIANIKKYIMKIIYLNLLHNLNRFKIQKSRVFGAGIDWDLVTCINEIRSYIYGSGKDKEKEIDEFINRQGEMKSLGGFSRFCVLVSSIQQFRDLDGWLVDVIQRALMKRYAIIAKQEPTWTKKPIPEKAIIINGQWHSHPRINSRLPSFVRAWRAARKFYGIHGIEGLEQPLYYSESLTRVDPSSYNQ